MKAAAKDIRIQQPGLTLTVQSVQFQLHEIEWKKVYRGHICHFNGKKVGQITRQNSRYLWKLDNGKKSGSKPKLSEAKKALEDAFMGVS